MNLAKRWILPLAIASVTVPVYAGEQEKAVGAVDSQTSKAVRLSDAELDQITAGTTFQLLSFSNPGNPNPPTSPGGSGHIVIITGGVADTFGTMTMTNPGRTTFTQCISSPQGFCF